MTSEHRSAVALLVSVCLLLLPAAGALPGAAAEPAGPASPLQLGAKRVVEHGTKTVSGPSLQVSESEAVHMAWIEEEKEVRGLYYLKTEAEAKTLPSPIPVKGPEEAVAAVHQSPGLALGRNGEAYFSWSAPHPQAGGKPFTSILRLSRLETVGTAAPSSVAVNDDNAVTNHAFDHVTVSRDGTVHVAWIDGREGKKEPATFTARSSDGGRTVTKNIKVDDGTCVCCRTALATAPDGTVYLAWRKILEGNVRETVVARSMDGGQTYSAPVIVGNDRWVFPGCPHRPASLGVDQGGRLYVVWYTEGADETPAIYLAVSDDQGRTFSSKRQLNVSKGTFPDHPQMAVDAEGRLVVVWEEQSPVRREVVMSYSLDRGQTFSKPQKLNDRKGQTPAVAMNHQGLVALAWVEQVMPGRKTVLQTVRLPKDPKVADAKP